MDAFSYLSVLLSIIIGLAMTQVLQGYRGLLLARGRVRLYAPPMIWSGLILLFATQSWWASFGLAGREVWSFAAFGAVLLQTVLLYMMAALVLPDIPAEGPADLRDHYFRETRPFFAAGLLMLLMSIGKDLMFEGHLPAALNVAFHALVGAPMLLALLTRRPLVHALIAPLMVLVVLSYIGLLFARL